jgi:branched-chain amino acid transport system permease protein
LLKGKREAEMEVLIGSIIEGLLVSLIYILIALGLTMLYGIMHIVNFAHGDIYMLGAMGTYFLTMQFGVPYFLSLLIVAFASIPFGLLVERVIFRPIRGKWLQLLVATIGLSMILQSMSWITFGILDKGFSSIFKRVIRFWGATISTERLFAAVVGAVLVSCTLLLVYRTKVGRAMRAIEEDEDSAKIQGVNPDSVSSINVVIGFILASIAGGLVAPIFVVNAGMGLNPLITAFIVIIIGGLGSITGCIMGGLFVGLVQTVGAVFLGVEITNGLLFALLIAVLVVRPAGLMGHA